MRETGLSLKNSEGSFTYRVGAFIIKDGKLLVAKSGDYPCFYTVGGAVEMNEDFRVSDCAYTDQVPKETLHWIPLGDIPNVHIVPDSLKSFDYDDLSRINHIISRES